MQKNKILIVDDEPDICEFMQLVLSNEGYEVDIANRGDEAIEKIQEHAYDLVFLDVVMPGKKGLRVFKDIKNIRPDTKICIMSGWLKGIEDAFSAYKKMVNIEGAIEKHIDCMLEKPISKDEVIQTAKNMLE